MSGHLVRVVAAAAALLLASCAGLDRSDQGVLQPQAVTGPCRVQKFFLLRYRSVPTNLAIGNTGEPCRFSILNPDLQVVLTGAIVTGAASHGQAAADLVSGARQGLVSYQPQPGYSGPDSFSVTFEPYALGITVHVRVQPPE